MALTPGLQLPYGIQPVNPVPVDTYSGPYSALTESAALSAANSSIPGALRFQSLEVRLIYGPTGSAVPYKYWYYGGTADTDLVPFGFIDDGVDNDPFRTERDSAGELWIADRNRAFSIDNLEWDVLSNKHKL